MSLRTVRDDLGEAVDPGVDLVPPSPLHLVVRDPPLLLPRGPGQPRANNSLRGPRSKIPRGGGGEDITNHIKLAC